METMSLGLVQFPLLLILVVAIVSDLRSRKIPNWLTGPATLLGLGLHTFINRIDGFLFSIEGIAVGLGLFLILYVLGWMGAGDAKLYAAVGAFLGPTQTLSAAVLIAMTGGLLSILALGVHQGWGRMGAWLWSLIQTLFLTRSLQPVAPADNSLKLPYAVAISIGTAWSFWWSPLG